MCGATSRLRKTTTDFRIGAGAHLNDGVVQKSAFARFLASFDFRLFQQHRPGPDILVADDPHLGLSRPSQGGFIMTSISILLALGGTLAALALFANGASAEDRSIHPATAMPKVTSPPPAK